MKIREGDKIILWGILAVFFLLKLSLIDYGLPYLFHPDEVYIYKTPFKIGLEYKALNFSSTTNLLFWLLPLWYLVGFLVGLVTGHFSGWQSFEQALIIESPFILFWGRMLSVAVSLAASYFLIRLWYRIAGDKVVKWCGVLIILCNPVEWVSNQWIKFDPYCYLILALLIYISYEYFFEKREKRRFLLYAVASLATALRIDLVVLLVVFLAADFLIGRASVTAVVKTFAAGMLVYLTITFTPMVILFKMFSHTPVVKTGTSFEEAIVTKYNDLLFSGKLVDTVWLNAKYYLIQIAGLIYLPYAFVFFLSTRVGGLRSRLIFYSSMALALFLPILPFPYFAPHYFLLPAVIATVMVLLVLDTLSRVKPVVAHALSYCCVLYFVSQIAQVLAWEKLHEDTRVRSRDFLLSRTVGKDVIALEGYLNPGYYPPLDECSDVLNAKAEIVRRFDMGSGEGFRLKAIHADSVHCRAVLEISFSDRFENKPGNKEWINRYDPVLLALQKPLYVASLIDYFKVAPQNAYQQYIQTAFFLERAFVDRPHDARVNVLFDRENYFPSLFIYRSRAK